jgi:hypothetical protein
MILFVQNICHEIDFISLCFVKRSHVLAFFRFLRNLVLYNFKTPTKFWRTFYFKIVLDKNHKSFNVTRISMSSNSKLECYTNFNSKSSFSPTQNPKLWKSFDIQLSIIFSSFLIDSWNVKARVCPKLISGVCRALRCCSLNGQPNFHLCGNKTNLERKELTCDFYSANKGSWRLARWNLCLLQHFRRLISRCDF